MIYIVQKVWPRNCTY